MDKKRIAIGLLIFTPIAVAIGVYLYARHRTELFAKNAHAAYTAQIRALGTKGVPLVAARLQGPLPPATRDAGPIYKQIAAQIAAHPPAGDDLLVTNGLRSNHILTTNETNKIHSALQRQAKLMALIHTAAQRPECDLRIDWSNRNPAAVLFPDFRNIRMGTRALSVESYDLASRGRMREAVKNQALGFQLADHAYTGKTIVATLVAVACDAITLEGMRKLLYLSHGDPATAQAIQDEVRNHLHIHPFSECLNTELTIQVSEIEFLREDGPGSLVEASNSDPHNPRSSHFLGLIPRSQWSAYLDDNGALVLAKLRRDRAIIDQPYPVSNPQMVASDAALEKAIKDSGPLRYTVAQMLTTNKAKFASRQTVIKASAAITDTSTRLLIFKSKTHSFPASLSALPNIPLDPFTGKPFKYRREGAGFVLYSVGEDGDFDGGTPAAKPKKYQSMFRYPMPPYYTTPIKEQ
jgi:hypothetical protein